MADKRSPFMGGGVAYAGGGRAMKREMRAGGGVGYKSGKMDVLFNRYEKNNQEIKRLKKKLESLRRVRKSLKTK